MSTAARTETELEVAPPCGPVRGWRDGAVRRATGIPYAVSERFAAPSPAPDWADLLDATQWSPACPQVGVPLLDEVLGLEAESLPADEQCQRLSVTMPEVVRPGESLPVMVWIHGGSYVLGAGDSEVMDPALLVAEQHVIVVTVTYRLGLFGFLGDGHDREANLGLLDMIQALVWVRRNIAAFGGDPHQVTIFGESAGGDAVTHLIASSDARQLFSRAIMQSPPLGLDKDREAMNHAMLLASAHLNRESSIEEILATEATAVEAAAPFGLPAGMPFGTQYGFAPLPPADRIEDAWRAAAPHVDVLIGHTSQEMRIFLDRIPQLEPWVHRPILGPVVRRAVDLVMTQVIYGLPTRRFACRHARAGGTAYRYVITWSAPGNPFGATHMVDLPLLFGNSEVWGRAPLVAGATWEDIDRPGRQIRRIWADFARGADLGDSGRVEGALRFKRVVARRMPHRTRRRA